MKVIEQLTELRGSTVEDLKKRELDLDDRVFRLRIQKSMGRPNRVTRSVLCAASSRA